MSQQINLYEARLRPRELILSGKRLGVGVVVTLLLCCGLAVAVRQHADQRGAEANRLQADVAAWQQKHDALSKQAKEQQVSSGLQNELDRLKAMLSVRSEVIALLDSGRLGNTEGFSALFYGFSRHATNDWWLTSFAIAMGGQEVDIRGKVLDAAKLPVYVQRLSQDPAFQGRRFAALTMNSIDPDDKDSEGAAAAKAADRPEQRLPRHVEFVLRTENAASAVKAGEGTK